MGDTKRKIIDTMYELIAEKGYDKTSIQQICDVIGIKKPSVYYYFKNKEEILLELIDSCMLDSSIPFLKILEVEDGSSYKEALLALGKEIVTCYRSDLLYPKVMTEIELQGNLIAGVKDRLENASTLYQEAIKNIIQKGYTLGVFKEESQLIHYCEVLLVLIEGIETTIFFKFPVDVEKVWEIVIEKLFD